MYPNLYYVFKDVFGVEWKVLAILNTFGLMMAISFVICAVVLSYELKRKEQQGLLLPREETVTVGTSASIADLLINFLTGFVFGFKLIGFIIDKPADPQNYIFSKSGNILAGIGLGLVLMGFKWWEKNKQKLKTPEQRNLRIWPHDRVGEIVILALVFGILGAKLFDNLENWDDFVQDPIGRIFSPGGLTFYGGLILAAAAIIWYAVKKGIKLIHLVDALCLTMMLAYALGRVGCQISGDGDWGIYNSAYITTANGKVVEAAPGEYETQLERYQNYFLQGEVFDSVTMKVTSYNGRTSPSLDKVPHKSFKAPSFIPVWMVAYNYPQNVNSDGVNFAGRTDEYNKVLPVPVFPTPFYEISICLILFLILFALRRKIKIAGMMTGIYMILNGLERFVVEKIRVNSEYHFFGLHPTQAEIISFILIISGIIMILFVQLKARNNKI